MDIETDAIEQEHQEPEQDQENDNQEDDQDQDQEQEQDETEEEYSIVFDGEEPKEQDEEDRKAPSWVKDLRKKHKEERAKRKELESKLKAYEQPENGTLRPEPTLEDHDYDQDNFKKDYQKWYNEKQEYDKKQNQLKEEQQQQAQAWEEKLSSYQAKKKELKVRGFEDAEENAREKLSVIQQGVIVSYAQDPAKMVYALGSNPNKLNELSKISDPIEFAIAVRELEKKTNMVSNKPKTKPEKTLISGGSASVPGFSQKTLDKLVQEANRTGDRTAVIQYKKKHKQA